MRLLCLVVMVAAMGSFTSGCGSKKEEISAEVTGTVLLDGQPLEEGRITFVPPDGGVPAGGEIQNGNYSVKARTGKNKVSITAFKVDPSIKLSNDPVRPIDNKVNYIPRQYNQDTTLTADIAPGKMSFDFKVSKK